MRLYAQLRSVLSALIVGLLIAAAISGECVACGIGVGSSLQAAPQSGACCEPDGHCKASPHKVPPAPCLKAHSNDVAMVEQPVQVHPVLPPAGFVTLASTEPVRQSETPIFLLDDYCPTGLHILYAALLI